MRVNAVVVGLVVTEQAHLFYGDEEGIAAVGATVPLGRMAEPADVADVCLFLASPLARYVTGARDAGARRRRDARLLGCGEGERRADAIRRLRRGRDRRRNRRAARTTRPRRRADCSRRALRSAHATTGSGWSTPTPKPRSRIPPWTIRRAIDWKPDDVVILAMKTQDTEAALAALPADDDLAIVCAQNGVENERSRCGSSRASTACA